MKYSLIFYSFAFCIGCSPANNPTPQPFKMQPGFFEGTWTQRKLHENVTVNCRANLIRADTLLRLEITNDSTNEVLYVRSDSALIPNLVFFNTIDSSSIYGDTDKTFMRDYPIRLDIGGQDYWEYITYRGSDEILIDCKRK